MRNFLKFVFLLSVLTLGTLACSLLKDKEDTTNEDIATVVAAFAVAGADGNACVSGSQCVSGTCINSTCGGVIASGGTIARGSACTTPNVFTPNQCINSTCGSTSFCGGKGAACQTSSNCDTPTHAGCGNLSGSSKLCGGPGAS